MRLALLMAIAPLALTANAAEHAILEMECRYPKSSTAGKGTARLSFESAQKREYVNVTYVLNATDLEAELRRRPSIQFTHLSADHFVSAGNVYIVRNIEKQRGLIDNACDEGTSLLIAKLQAKSPVEVLGLPNIELYLLNEIGKEGWGLVQNQVTDTTDNLYSNVLRRYYFRLSP